MIIYSPEPIAFYLFNIPIYYYGIIMAIAVLGAVLTANYLFNKVETEKDFILNNSPYFIIGGLFGARLYFCILNFQYYFYHPIQILNIRQGGLSIHGAILTGIFIFYILSKLKKTSLWHMLDSIACGTFLGQAIGRWGNFFNAEAFGLPTNSQNFGLFIPQSSRPIMYADVKYFHPTFLYESVLDFLAFLLLIYLYKKYSKNISGMVFFTYLTVYSTIRFFIEYIRIDSALNIGSIPFAQIISVILFLIGAIGILITVKKYKNI